MRIAALLLAFTCRPAAAQSVTEYQVKAAFLFNFTKFVEWPSPSPAAPFRIGIVGDDPFGGALEQVVKNRVVDDRPIEIHRLKLGAPAIFCEIVFFSVAAKDVRAALAPFQDTAVLTVGDAPGFCKAGGMIGLHLVDNKVRLEINPDAAQRAGLQVSSKLLALASLVRETHP